VEDDDQFLWMVGTFLFEMEKKRESALEVIYSCRVLSGVIHGCGHRGVVRLLGFGREIPHLIEVGIGSRAT
jgi:hypothetical protein